VGGREEKVMSEVEDGCGPVEHRLNSLGEMPRVGLEHVLSDQSVSEKAQGGRHSSDKVEDMWKNSEQLKEKRGVSAWKLQGSKIDIFQST
jgi:hypothetical protein